MKYVDKRISVSISNKYQKVTVCFDSTCRNTYVKKGKNPYKEILITGHYFNNQISRTGKLLTTQYVPLIKFLSYWVQYNPIYWVQYNFNQDFS